MAAVSARDLDDLYTVPPSEFVRTRNALVARLRETGQAAKAAEIGRLRKPHPSIWVINRLAREHPRPLASFIAAVDDLKRAHLRAPHELAQATDRQREALNELLARARRLLTAGGLRPSLDMLDRASATLLGAAADPGARRELQQGCLTHELQAPGFEVFAGAPPPRRQGRSAPLKKELRVATATARDLERRAVDLERAAARHRKVADEAGRAAEQLAERLRQAQEASRRARRAAEEAERGARHAREEATRAQTRARDTERQLVVVEKRRGGTP